MHYQKVYSSVLHLGCRQGRDALFITRKGHTVLGVDAVQTAIKKMLKLAVLENLIVNGIFAGNIDFDVDDVYDVVLITEYFIYCKKIK